MNLFGVPVPDDVVKAAMLAAVNKRQEEAKKDF